MDSLFRSPATPDPPFEWIQAGPPPPVSKRSLGQRLRGRGWGVGVLVPPLAEGRRGRRVPPCISRDRARGSGRGVGETLLLLKKKPGNGSLARSFISPQFTCPKSQFPVLYFFLFFSFSHLPFSFLFFFSPQIFFPPFKSLFRSPPPSAEVCDVSEGWVLSQRLASFFWV